MAPLNELQLRRFDTVAAEVPMTRVRIGARTWATDDYVLTLLMAGLYGALGFGVRELAISTPEEMIDDVDHDA